MVDKRHEVELQGVDPALTGSSARLVRWLQQVERRVDRLEKERRCSSLPGTPVLEGWYPRWERGHSARS